MRTRVLTYVCDDTSKDISLRKIARDLDRVAPDLVEESLANLNGDRSDRSAATIIQMQLIQESNNNWDPLFPENEHVWDFAAERLDPIASRKGKQIRRKATQYFSLRRFPVWAQSELVQDAIRSPGPGAQGTHAPTVTSTLPTALIKRETTTVGGRERYTGRCLPPTFPFGETAFQRAALSMKIEQELADG